MTPGAYLRLCRQAAGLSLDDVAAQFATCPRIARHVRAELVATIEQDIAPASFMTIAVLAAIYPIDMRSIVALCILAEPPARADLLIVTVVE